MPSSIRPELYALFLLGALLLAGPVLGGPYPVLLPLVCLASVAAWLSALRRERLFKDTPTSSIATAAQGHVELIGQAKCLPGEPLLSPLTGTPVAWYRLQTEEKASGKWRTVRDHTSTAPFMIDDGSGVCAVDLGGTSPLVRKKQSVRKGHLRHTEWTLREGAPVYAIGEFATVEHFDPGRDEDEDEWARAHEALAAWQADQADFVSRFDHNRDGTVDTAEWQQARKEARRFAASRGLSARPEEGINVLRAPGDGRLFLVADFNHRQLNDAYGTAKWLLLADVIVGAALLIQRFA